MSEIFQEVFLVKLSELRKISQIIPDPSSIKSSEQLHKVFLEHGFEPGSFYQELEMDSPYVDTHQDVSYSNHNFQFHSHNFYEMLCCRNSCNAEYLVGTERYKLRKGDIIFVPPGISHRPLLPEQMTEPYIRDVLWISDEFLQILARVTPELTSSHFDVPFLFRTVGTGWEFICDLIREGVKEAEAGDFGWRNMIAANTSNILIHLVRAGQDNPVNPMKAEKPELLDRVLAYVEDHLSEKITLAEIARNFFVSESTITQTFRKKMGISFYRCVTQRRLIAAKRMIENGCNLDTTAERVGFSDYSSFFRAFKQEYGISPRQYRKMQSN